MSMISQNLKWCKVLVVFCVSIFAILAANPIAFAQEPVLELTIMGGASATIINGELVEFGWYIDGPVANCVLLRDGTYVLDIDTSVVPVSALIGHSEVPPSGASTIYTVSCDGISDSVSADAKPIVTMSLPEGDERITDPRTGILGVVTVNWTSTFATECSNVWKTDVDGTSHASSPERYQGKNSPEGWVQYRDFPHGTIDKSTTFYISCTNAVNGTTQTGSVSLTVVDPPPPVPPVVNMWTNPPEPASVTPDPLYGFARADVSFNSIGVTSCKYRAYYVDGTQYPTNPSGFGTWSGPTSKRFDFIRIATTTDFEVECSRGEVELNGVIYSATSSMDRVRVTVATGTSSPIDRTLLPPVTASATVTPNPAIKNAITGSDLIRVDTAVANADYCMQYAYRFNPASGLYDSRYDLSGWSLEYGWNRRGNGDITYVAFVSESTRLELDCRREYDYLLGTVAERENGTELTSVIVIVEDAVVSAPPPVTYMYGNAVSLTAEDIGNVTSELVGFYRTNDRFETPSGTSTGNTLTFPFSHPFGGSDTYNLHATVCDESDGESTFDFFTEQDGLVGSLVTNSIFAPSTACNSGTTVTKIIAQGLTIDDGDDITVECSTPDDGERCSILNLHFGAGDGGTVSVPVDTLAGFTNVPVMWMSENTTRCGLANASSGAINYPWYFGNNTSGFLTTQIGTTTELSIECGRDGDALTATSSVILNFPTAIPLAADALVATGECLLEVDGELMAVDLPVGFIADTSGLCILAVDLEAISPGISPIAENGVAGTHNFKVLTGIKNLGPGILPPDSDISYVSKINLRPVYAAITVPDSPYASFMGGLDPDVNGGESGTLTNQFSNVPFGSHQLCTHVNEDNPAGNFPEIVGALANNQMCSNISLEIPEPTMTFEPSRKVIRSGQSVDLTWNINVGYELQCGLQGAGGLNIGFNALNEPAQKSGTFTTSAITSTSEFLFECFLPNPGLYFSDPSTQTTVFSQQVTVEVVPDFEEI